MIGFALLTAIAAQIRVPLPGTPVPVTLQTLAVLLAGITLGPWLGAASMALYLCWGLLAGPVFAVPAWGPGTLLGATGGYLIGFTLAQPAIGLITRAGRGRLPGILAAVLAGNLVIFACGLTWLHVWLGTGLAATLAMGLWPFLPGLVAKTLAATGAGRLLQPLARTWFDR